MTGTLILLAGLLGAAYFLSHRDIFSPGVLTCSIFSFCLLSLLVLPTHLPPLHKQCLFGVGLWSVCFVLSAMMAQSFRYTPMPKRSSTAVTDLYFWLSIACVPLLIRFAYEAIVTGTSSNFAANLRDAAINGLPSSSTKEPYTPFYYMLWIATYLLYLKDINRTRWRRAVIMGGLVLSFGLVSMSKTFILTFGIMTLLVLYYRKIIATRHILLGLAVLVVLLWGMQFVRYHTQMSEEKVASTFEMYVLGNFYAFDTLKPCTAEHWGEHVFRLYYVLTYKAGLSPVEPVDPILPWVMKPIATNTYTVLYPFFLDFGYWGIAFFAIVLGLATGWLYSHYRQGDEFFVLLYAYFCVLLITQYNGEAFFTNLAGHIKFVLLMILPYLTLPKRATKDEL